MSLLDDARFREDLQNIGLSGADVAAKWPGQISKSTVNEYRRALAKKDGLPTPLKVAKADEAHGYKFESNEAGALLNTRPTETPQTRESALEILRAKGIDPELHDVTFGFSEWEQATKDGDLRTLYAVRVSAKPKTVAGGRLVSTSDVIDAIKSFTYIPEPVAYADESFVIVPTDFQFGKVDWNGGSRETHEQILTSFGKAQDFIREFRPREVCIVDAGDIIENIYSTSSQLATNDLSLPDQVVEAAYAMQRGLQMLAPHTKSLRYAAVSSNHGAHRLGPKSPAGDVHADYGLAVAKMLRNALTLNPEAFGM